MRSRSHPPPPVLYVLAMTAGFVGLPFMLLLADFTAGPHGVGGGDSVRAGWFAVGYAVLGAIFGLLWPGPAWRWGLWLTALPLFLVFLLDPGMWVWLGWAAQIALPACSAAYAAARLHLRYTEVDEAG
jgi:hypothetical protein